MDEWTDDEHPELARDLKALFAPREGVPEARERAFLRAAGRRIRMRRVRPWRWAAAAALLLAFGWLARGAFDPSGERTEREARTPYDVDRDGRVDVRDAWLVARRVAGLERPAPEHDVNGDGRVDAEDVDLLLARAVSLTEDDGR